MAINKTITLPSGLDVTYWKIVSAYFSFRDMNVRIELFGYKDRQARVDGREPADTKIITVPFTTDDRAELYEYLKASPEFLDAQDA